jgi:hypothetical protein
MGLGDGTPEIPDQTLHTDTEVSGNQATARTPTGVGEPAIVDRTDVAPDLYDAPQSRLHPFRVTKGSEESSLPSKPVSLVKLIAMHPETYAALAAGRVAPDGDLVVLIRTIPLGQVFATVEWDDDQIASWITDHIESIRAMNEE